MKTELGKCYRDKLTGFVGIATGKITYLTGCDQTVLQPREIRDGKKADSEWFDDGKLEPSDAYDAVNPSDFQDDRPGADFTPPVRRG